MVWEGARFVLVKVKDCIIKEKHLILSSAPEDKWTIFISPGAALLCSLGIGHTWSEEREGECHSVAVHLLKKR